MVRGCKEPADGADKDSRERGLVWVLRAIEETIEDWTEEACAAEEVVRREIWRESERDDEVNRSF